MSAVVRMTLALLVLVFAPATAQAAETQSWYVSAAAPAGGDGSQDRPFATLAAVEQASHAGDAIIVLPSTTALDGGIALKPDQKLEGAGPTVIGVAATTAAARLANSGTTHGGDAVVLADGAEVGNIAVTGATRGGIYGANVTDVDVHDNDLTATNTSCATGFVVQPFTIPSMAPGIGLPFSSGLPNGWAAIMIDARDTPATLTIAGNTVHDTSCADGIDVRASGTASVTARVDGNVLARLRQDSSKQSILAIGMQTTDTSRLTADVTNNSETYIGTPGLDDFGDADSEGLFANSAGPSHLIERADHNTFSHGLGHLSANCVEVAASNGGPTMDFTLTNSTCDYVVGDILEAGNLSADSKMTFTIDNVHAAHSTFPAGTAFHQAEPGDDGDCMLIVASGANSTTDVRISNSEFTDCVTDGIGVVSNVVDGSGPVKKIAFDIRNSRITANKLANLRVAAVTPIDVLDGRVEDTDLSDSDGTPVILENLDTSGATNAQLDLGGGSLGSHGHNCIHGGGQADVLDVRHALAAAHNWWGTPGGPAPGRAVAVGAAIASGQPLETGACGPS